MEVFINEIYGCKYNHSCKNVAKGEKKEEPVVVGLEQMQLESPNRAVKSIGELDLTFMFLYFCNFYIYSIISWHIQPKNNNIMTY